MSSDGGHTEDVAGFWRNCTIRDLQRANDVLSKRVRVLETALTIISIWASNDRKTDTREKAMSDIENAATKALADQTGQ